MTPQAKNSMELYRGGNPSTIKRLLKRQATSVVKELMEHFDLHDLDALAMRLSLG